MATVYKVEIVSDWILYDKEELKEILQDRIDPDVQNFRVVEVECK
jgi:hypothetical protein